MLRVSRQIMLVAAALLFTSCQRSTNPRTSVSRAEPSKTTMSPTLVVHKPKMSDDNQAPWEKAAREFLHALVSGSTKTAVEKTTTEFRRLVSGPLTFTEEQQLGYSDGDTERFLSECRGQCREFQIAHRRQSPEGGAALFRGTLQGEGKFRSFTLRLTREGDLARISWFFAAETPTAPSLPDHPNAEIVWAGESATDFLLLLLGSSPEHRLTLSLLTEEFKASLPAPSVADAGLPYAKRDVRNWLNGLRANRLGFQIDSYLPKGDQVMVRGRFIGNGQSPFVMALSKTPTGWKVHGWEKPNSPD